jgi:hypothetical protein
MSEQKIDNLKRQCPRLGSPIPFNYCMMSGEDDGICWKILDCWWETFDVEAYLKANMPESAFQQLMATADKPKNKIASILDIVEQAKKAKGEESP